MSFNKIKIYIIFDVFCVIEKYKYNLLQQK